MNLRRSSDNHDSHVNPQDFGRIEAKVQHLETQMSELRADVRNLIGMLEQARGGWRALMVVGGIAGAVGALLGKIAGWWLASGGKV